MTEKILALLQGGLLQPFSFFTSGLGARIATIVDIILVATLLLVLFRFLRRTRANNILLGFIIVGLGIVVARLLNFVTLNLLLTIFFGLLLFATPFLFQPELRRGLEKLGRKGPFWRSDYEMLDDKSIRSLAEAVESLQNHKHGALIVLEKKTGLSEYVDTGVVLDAEVSKEILETIFFPGSPLHDGAVIIRDGYLAAAACTLPLAEENSTTGRMGTRHRAALGVSENSDAIAIVVSEERGTISLASDGKMYKVPTPHDISRFLHKFA